MTMGDGTIIAPIAKTLHKCLRIARSPALRFSMPLRLDVRSNNPELKLHVACALQSE
jgi:hypothetical protein